MNSSRKIVITLFAILLVAQFFKPEKNNGSLDSVKPFIAETNPPENVLKILETSCFDCHSSKTKYPWYNNCLLYTSPSPRDKRQSRMPSSA